jgi:hypothetical protein
MKEAHMDRSIARRFAVVGVVIPAIVTVLGVVIQVLALPHVPDPVAVHWGFSGGPDGSGPAWSYLVLTLLFGAGFPLWLALSALPRVRAGSRGWSFRFLGAFSLGFAVFGAVSWTWALLMQMGLDSWQDAPSVVPSLIVGAVLGIAAGLIGYAVQPKSVTVFEELPVAHLDVASGERVMWVGVAKAGKGSVIAVSIGVAALVVGAIVCWAAQEYAVMWLLVGLAVLIGALGLTMLEADVRVDATGVEVRGPAGWPKSRIALADIGGAQAIRAEALGSFGGWGWRRVPGALGVILRNGEALKVDRKQGHSLVVTVDDAGTAAALVNALAARQGA